MQGKEHLPGFARGPRGSGVVYVSEVQNQQPLVLEGDPFFRVQGEGSAQSGPLRVRALFLERVEELFLLLHSTPWQVSEMLQVQLAPGYRSL